MSNGTTIILEKGDSTEDEYLKTIQEYFKENKYIVIREFIDQNLSNLLYQYVINKAVRADFLEQNMPRPSLKSIPLIVKGSQQIEHCIM